MEMIDRVRSSVAPLYEVSEEIGRGGSSVIYRAHESRHERDVALKVLLPDVWGGLSEDRFHREIRIAATLHHPNILPLLDSGSIDGLLYYVMPLVEGESLRDRLKREKQLSLEAALSITLDVADGLAYAHERGVIHRDIKPANILLSGDRAVIADFGIATAASLISDDFKTATGHAPGTPSYMSPEQAAVEAVDGRSDQYSLGCVLYEALVGEPPFTGPTAQAVVARHMLERPPSVEVVRPTVPPSLAGAIDRTLAKVPADRFESVADFAAALRSGDLTADLRTRTRRRRLRSWIPRVAVAAVAAVAALTGWNLLRPTAALPLDERKVVVFPLAVLGQPEVRDLGWDVALAIETALEHAAPLRWIDGRLWLPEEARRDADLITPVLAGTIGRDRGAAHYLTGVVRVTPDSVAVTIRLHDVDTGSILGQETEWESRPALAYRAGMTAVTPLLGLLLEPGRSVDLTPFTNRELGAVALTIQGDRQYRLSRFEDALDFYRRAVEEDSLLAIAATRGATAAVWEEKEEEALTLAELAVRHDSLLPERHRLYAKGVQAYLSGDADGAVLHLRRALAADDEWVEATTILGETYQHLFPSGADPSLAGAQFERSTALDSTFTPPMLHRIEASIRTGDTAAARASLEWLTSLSALEADRVGKLELMIDCVRTGPADFRGWEEAAQSYPDRVLAAGKDLSVAGRQVECAERAFRSLLDVPDYQWGAVLGLQSVLLAQGRTEEASALLDRTLGRGDLNAYALYLFDSPLSDQFEQGAASADSFARAALGDDYTGMGPVHLWLTGVWYSGNGDAVAAERIAGLVANAPGSPRQAKLLSDAIRGHAALAAGREDEAISRFAALKPTAPLWDLYWELGESLAIERILQARAHLARGEHDAALRIATLFDHAAPITYLAYLAPSLAIRFSAAKALGLDDLAEDCRRRLERLGWTDGILLVHLEGPLLSTFKENAP